MMTKHILALVLLILSVTSCSTTNFLSRSFPGMDNNNKSIQVASNVNLNTFPQNMIFWQGNADTIWDRLQQVPLSRLQSASTEVTDPISAAWIKLAIINQQNTNNTAALSSQLIAWSNENPSHPGNQLLPPSQTLMALQRSPQPRHIAILLPLQGKYASSGQTVRDGFLSAYYQTRPAGQQVSFYDTSTNANISALYQRALAEGADSVVGPLIKSDVEALLSQGNFPVQTLALNYTTQWFGSLPKNFYEFGLSPEDESLQVADKASLDGLSHAIIIAPENEWGHRVVQTLVSRWNAAGKSVSDTLYFTSQTNLTDAIAQLLHVNPKQSSSSKMDTKQLRQQRRQDFDVIFLFAEPRAARQIVPLLKYYYADNVPIYSTSVVYGGSPSPQDSDLSGVIFGDMPWTLQNAANPSSKKGANDSRLYAVGRDAYILSNQLPRLSLLPHFPISGATGGLTLTPQQKIYRRISWTKMPDA